MTIYKSFKSDLSNRDISMLSGTVNTASWERTKPYLEQLCGLKPTEELKGIEVNEQGIKMFISTKKS